MRIAFRPFPRNNPPVSSQPAARFLAITRPFPRNRTRKILKIKGDFRLNL